MVHTLRDRKCTNHQSEILPNECCLFSYILKDLNSPACILTFVGEIPSTAGWPIPMSPSMCSSTSHLRRLAFRWLFTAVLAKASAMQCMECSQ